VFVACDYDDDFFLTFASKNTDAPECRPQQKMLYGVEAGQWLQIDCQLWANPPSGLTFHWRSHSPDGQLNRELASISSSSDGRLVRAPTHQLPTAHALQTDLRSALNKMTDSGSSATTSDGRQQVQLFVASNHTTSTLQYRVQDTKAVGSVSCYASNSVGVQKQSCVFNLMPLGKLVFLPFGYN
jgi:hypothetical protein